MNRFFDIRVQFIKVSWALAGTSFNELDLGLNQNQECWVSY